MPSPSSLEPCRTLLVDGGHASTPKFGKVMADVGFDVDRCGAPSDGVGTFDRHELVVLLVKNEPAAQSARHFVSWLRNHDDYDREPLVVVCGPKKVIAQFSRLRCRLLEDSLESGEMRTRFEDLRDDVTAARGETGGSFWSRLFPKPKEAEPGKASPAPSLKKEEKEVASMKPARAQAAKRPTVAPDVQRAKAAMAKSGNRTPVVSKPKFAGLAEKSVEKADAPAPVVAKKSAPTVKSPVAAKAASQDAAKSLSTPAIEEAVKKGAVSEVKKPEPSDKAAAKAGEGKAKVDPFLAQLAKSDTLKKQLNEVSQPAQQSAPIHARKERLGAASSEGSAVSTPAAKKSPAKLKKPDASKPDSQAKTEAPSAKPAERPQSKLTKGKTSRLGELEIALDTEMVARKKAETKALELEEKLKRKTSELVALVDSLAGVAGAAAPMSPPSKAGSSDASGPQKPRCALMYSEMLSDVLGAKVDAHGCLDASGLLLKQVTRNFEACGGDVSQKVVVDMPDEPLWVDSRAALPLVMVMCECVCNALEHGLSMGEKEGVIRVQFTRLSDELIIEVCDTGAGLPLKFDLNKLGATGLGRAKQLVAGLGGRLVVNAATETRCQVNLPAALLGKPEKK